MAELKDLVPTKISISKTFNIDWDLWLAKVWLKFTKKKPVRGE